MHQLSTHFDKYSDHKSVMSKEIGIRLIERLAYIKLNPTSILDLGCGSGYFSKLLKKKYPKAQVFGLDCSLNMIKKSREQQSLLKRWSTLCGDLHQLPFKNKQFDLVFANQSFNWSNDLSVLFSEVKRVMSPGGCLMFSMLGPDTYQELADAAQAITMPRYDMHIIGDALLNVGFGDPVLDSEHITLNIRMASDVLKILRADGVRTKTSFLGLRGRRFLSHTMMILEQQSKFKLTYEVNYGHAWRVQDKQKTLGQETYIPLDILTSKLNRE